MRSKFFNWFGTDTPWVWLNAAAIAISLCMVSGVILFIAIEGLKHFWPSPVVFFEYASQQEEQNKKILGNIRTVEVIPANRAGVSAWEVDTETSTATRYLIEIGNRELYGFDFRWGFCSSDCCRILSC